LSSIAHPFVYRGFEFGKVHQFLFGGTMRLVKFLSIFLLDEEEKRDANSLVRFH